MLEAPYLIIIVAALVMAVIIHAQLKEADAKELRHLKNRIEQVEMFCSDMAHVGEVCEYLLRPRPDVMPHSNAVEFSTYLRGKYAEWRA